MNIVLIHPVHGAKVATHEAEIATDEANGWTRQPVAEDVSVTDDDQEDLSSLEDFGDTADDADDAGEDLDPAPDEYQKPRRGRPPKGQ